VTSFECHGRVVAVALALASVAGIATSVTEPNIVTSESHRSQPEDHRWSQEAGFGHHLDKPIDSDTLAEILS
jgi:hypothetical protein